MIYMSGLTNDQRGLLRHNRRNSQYIMLDTILHQIWYSSSHQAYIQRSTAYDDTIFNRKSSLYLPVVDALMLAMIHKVFCLDAIAHLDSYNDLEQVLLQEYERKEKILLLGNTGYKESVLYAFDDKLRNSFAHGTFNVLEDGTMLCVGQAKAKQESQLNFYLRIINSGRIHEWHSMLGNLPSDLGAFAKFAYGKYHNLQETDAPNLYLRNDKEFVCFDCDFRFSKVKDGAPSQDAQIRQRIANSGILNIVGNSKTLFYFIAETSNSEFSETLKTYPNINVIAANKLLDHLEIKAIKLKQV